MLERDGQYHGLPRMIGLFSYLASHRYGRYPT
jgi:hypothetical protein